MKDVFECLIINGAVSLALERNSAIFVNLEIFWLRDESLEDSANLPALEIVEDLQAALEQFSGILEALGSAENGTPD